MPFHDWICEGCDATMEVRRSMDEAGVPPRQDCPCCKGKVWRKKIALPQRAWGARSENDPYPMRVRHLEKPEFIKDDKGNFVMDPSTGMPRMKRDPIVFQSKAHQDAYLDKHDLIRLADVEDPSVGSSQHSVFDKDRDPAPTENAERMVSRASFIEDPNAMIEG